MAAPKYPERTEKVIADCVGALTAAVGGGWSPYAGAWLQRPEYKIWNLTGTWDKEDKDDKEFEHMRGAELVSGDARITNIANKTEDKTEHICG